MRQRVPFPPGGGLSPTCMPDGRDGAECPPGRVCAGSVEDSVPEVNLTWTRPVWIGLLPLLMATSPISPDREWDVLPPAEDDAAARSALAIASWHLVDCAGVELAGVHLDARRLQAWASAPMNEPLERYVREDARRPIDLTDTLFLLDDVIRDDRCDEVVLPAGRARSAGLLVHPSDVFRDQSRDYGRRSLDTSRPTPQRWVPPAQDGTPLGVRWTTRFPNPETAGDRLDALVQERPDSDFHERIASLAAQLESQGALVWITSTARDPRRGYLLWGSFLLSKTRSAADVSVARRRLEAGGR